MDLNMLKVNKRVVGATLESLALARLLTLLRNVVTEITKMI